MLIFLYLIESLLVCYNTFIYAYIFIFIITLDVIINMLIYIHLLLIYYIHDNTTLPLRA